MKMKKNLLFATLAIALIFASCKSTPKNNQEVNSNDSSEKATITYAVDNSLSTIKWTGSKLVGGGHTGTINLVDGVLHGNESKLVDGKMTIDMKSLLNTDITDKGKSADLVGHLKSPDFFDTEKFPTAVLEIIKIEMLKEASADKNAMLTSKLTIKGVSNEILIPALITIKEDNIAATASFKIDRKKWGINYGTEGSVADLAKDRIINNDIEFNVSINASKVK